MTNKTKFIVLVGDGMADYPLKELGERTPLEAADTPNMDRIASCGIGLAGTVPEGMEPGSDVANLVSSGMILHSINAAGHPLRRPAWACHLTRTRLPSG